MTNSVRTACRALLRAPAFVVPAIIAVSIGFGAAVTLFGLVHAVFLQPIPYPDAEQLVWMRERHADVPARQISYPTFRDWEARSESFRSMAAVRNVRLRSTAGSEARVLNVAIVTADYFRVLGVRPSLGRDFASTDDRYGAPGVAIVSDRFRRGGLDGRPGSLGSNLTIDDQSYSVIGVAPAEPRFPGEPDVWILMGQRAAPDSAWLDRSVRWGGFVIARLRSDRSIQQARADIAGVQRQMALEYPLHVAGNEAEILSLRESLVGDMRLPVLLSFGAVAVLLLIVCVNVSNLLVLRAVERQEEMAIRTALGARPRTLFAQMLGEGLLLTALGCTLGMAFAVWGTKLLDWLLSDLLFEGLTVAVGRETAAFALALALALGPVTSLLPAWKSAFGDSQGLGRGARATAGPTTGRALGAFLVFQVSLAVVLLVCASLLVVSMSRILASDPGFDKDGVATYRLLLPRDYRSRQQLNRLYARLARDLRAIPGVEAAAVFNDLPGLEPTWQSDIVPEVQGEYRGASEGQLINVDWRIVSPGYFETMAIPLVRGRTFTEDEAEQGASVMLVDESLADRFWPDGGAIGSHIKYDGPTPVEIIGITANVHTYGAGDPGRITIYTPYGRFPFLGDVGAAIRADGVDPESLAASVRSVVRGIDAGIAIFDVATLNDLLAAGLAPRKLTSRIIALFASFAVLLSTIGIYSVMSYVVAQRRCELAVRAALGAGRRDIVGHMLEAGVRYSAGGIAIGLVAALGASRLLSGMLYGIGPASPIVYAFVAILSFLAAVVGCSIPVWRASRADPVMTLRAG